MSVLKIYDGENWRVVGLQGIQGETGLVGFTGLAGYDGVTGTQGITGIIGLQGETGPQIIMDQMLVEKVENITGFTPTGVEALDYVPITGLNTSVTLTKDSKILSLLYLRYRNVALGSHTVTYLLQSDGETGPFFSDYLPDSREKSEVIYQVTSSLPAGTHNMQAYWKIDTVGRQSELLRGDLSSVVLEGSYGVTGIQGITGLGILGPTGAFGGPPGETGAMGHTGLAGIPGATGPGLASFEKFAKILPMESWRVFDVDFDVFGAIPVLKFDSTGSERIENTLATPLEWNGIGDINLKIGTILNTPLSAGAQLSLRLSYKGFNKDTNVGTLAPYNTDIVTKTFTSPSQYDFSEFVFTLDEADITGYDYIHLVIEKLTGSPDVSVAGVCSSLIEHGVSIGMGSTGSLGLDGATGLPGPTGIIGATGETGAPGLTGVKGDTGNIGIQGPTGAFGGPQGDTGLPGPTGLKGDTGPAGLGLTGLIGATGLVGITGAFGGPQGDTGLPGDTGLSGDQGETGLPGSTGETGSQGHTGASTIGETGLPGPTGWQGVTGYTGETGPAGYGLTGIQGETGAQGDQGETGSAAFFMDEPIYNNVSRYPLISTAGEEVWAVSSSTVFVGLTWSRSGTTLTVYSPNHGHITGNRVIIRNTNLDYQQGLIISTDTNYFTFTTSNTGDTSGTSGAYSLGFTYAHTGDPKTGGTLSAPSGIHADCQLISLRIRTGSRVGTSYVLTVPESAVNGAGANTSLGDCYMPDFNIRSDSDTLSAVPATMLVNSGASGYEVFTFGALGTLSRFICLHF